MKHAPNTFARMGTALCTGGIIATLLAPGTALAAGQTGTTQVTVKTNNENIEFEVPLVINFSAGPDGVLTGPSPESTVIRNESVFGIHVTNMHITAESPWTLVADATAAEQANAIDFQVGPDNDMRDARNASQEGGIDLSANAQWDMGHAGSDSDTIQLSSAGNISYTTEDLYKFEDKVATITWTIEAGQHAQ